MKIDKKVIQVFVSHTKKDVKFCDMFDRACARVGIKAFRSEFEAITSPPWKTIKDAMNNSIALFFLVGKELVKSQSSGSSKWKHTQNWITYEIGLACQQRIDVWAICDDVLINFPMPYINNYLTVSLKQKPAFDYLRGILERYQIGQNFHCPFIIEGKNIGVTCPYKGCKMRFNLHVAVALKPGSIIKCPQCLQNMEFPKGRSKGFNLSGSNFKNIFG